MPGNAAHLPVFMKQADLSGGWMGMFAPENEKEGEHGVSFSQLFLGRAFY